MMRRYRGLLLSLLLLGIGLFLSILFNPIAAVESEAVAIQLDTQQQIVGRIYTPRNTSAPYPVVLLCHGFNANKQMMAPLAVELARHGIAAIAFDFRGFGESSRLPQQSIDTLEFSTLADAKTVLSFVRDRPAQFDLNRIGIGGHSLGGTTALELAQLDPRLRVTFLLGMSGPATPTSPQNLFLGVGLYEQLNPPRELRTMLQQATGSPTPTCINTGICGEFSTGTARQLFISPTADHIVEPYDPLLIEQVVNWTVRALDVPGDVRSPTTLQSIVGLLIAFGGGIGCGIWMFLRTGQPVRLPEIRALYRYSVSGLILLVMGVLWVLAASGLGPTRGATNMLMFCYVLLVWGNYALRYPEKVSPGLRVGGLYGLLCFSAFVVPALVSGIGEAIANPRYLISLPQFLLQWPFFTVYNYTQVIKIVFFPAYTFELQPSVVFFLLVSIEFIWPGETVTVLERLASWSIQGLRRPLRFTGLGAVSRKMAGFMAVLVLVLAMIVYQRVSDGLLAVASSQGMLVLQLVGQMVLLPVGVMVLTVRSRGFRDLERKAIGCDRGR